jgi:NADP-dependent 3-hydroxy acid dehydrogenase YdfG
MREREPPAAVAAREGSALISKLALVTGASCGIGRAFAQRLAAGVSAETLLM